MFNGIIFNKGIINKIKKRAKGVNLFIYRIIRIGIHNGYIHFFKFAFISKIIIKLYKLFYNFLKLNRYDIERTKFSWK